MILEGIIGFNKKGYEGRNFITVDSNSVIKNNTILNASKWYTLTGLAIRYLKWRYK